MWGTHAVYVEFFGSILSLFLKYIVRVPVDQYFVARPGETTATLMFCAVLNKGYTADSLSASPSSYLEYAAVIGCFWVGVQYRLAAMTFDVVVHENLPSLAKGPSCRTRKCTG